MLHLESGSARFLAGDALSLVVSFQVVKIDIGFGQHSKNEALTTGLSLVIRKYHNASFDILYITYFQT